MEHYVLINDWSTEYEHEATILGVYHSLDEAKERFDSCIEDERNYAEEHGYKIYEDNERCFDAGKDGEYAMKHTNLYIQLVRNLMPNE